MRGALASIWWPATKPKNWRVRRRRQCNAPAVYWCKRKVKDGRSVCSASVISVQNVWWRMKLSTAMDIVIIDRIVLITPPTILNRVFFAQSALAAMSKEVMMPATSRKGLLAKDNSLLGRSPRLQER
jgi:hypothetical protein